MNNKNVNLEENKEMKFDLAYIRNKIDEIVKMNMDLINNQDFANVTVMPGTKNPVECICETNNKMIDFLQDIYKSLQPKVTKEINFGVIESLTNVLNDAIGDVNCDTEVVNRLIDTLSEYIEM